MIDGKEGNVMDLQGENWRVMFGSCLDRLPEIADESVDAVVCDPPYELGFMGKSWDSSGIAYNVDVWRECLRVLKPGGHILAFGGSRTWHRLAVAIEDAGFELRDSIAWLYGSGFPKSLDVSKAIDKSNGKHEVDLSPFGVYVKQLREAKGLSRKELDEVMGTNTAVSWWEGRAAGVQLPSRETYYRLKEVIEMDDRFDSLIEWAEAEREVIGKKTSGIANSAEKDRHTIGASQSVIVDVTAPATDEAKKWAGWGTALKPAFEPVVVGRKPLKGTVAGNVLAYGVGGLNIDATRIGSETSGWNGLTSDRSGSDWDSSGLKGTANPTASQGRWPSNVILDEYTAELVDQQSGFSKSSGVINRWTDGAKPFGNGAGGAYESVQGVADFGGASRFFYIAKANKRDRNEGLDWLEEVEASVMVDREEGSAGMNSPRAGAGRTSGAKNFHPTVKPTDLMRQLIRLVTPLGGVVLDPFTGSGSTGKAAILEGMQFIGCELTEDYLPIIQGRIDWAVEQVKIEADKEGEKLF